MVLEDGSLDQSGAGPGNLVGIGCQQVETAGSGGEGHGVTPIARGG